GSTFSVRIPQGVVSEEAIGDFHRRYEDGLKSLKAYHESFRAPDAHILVVDDTKLNLLVIEGLLKTTEVRLDTAAGGEEALVMSKKTAYDLILLDQRMPRMSGTETLQHIRTQENGRNRETPVICLTADAVQGARERYLAEGFSGYLSKPVEGPALEAALMEYLPAEKILRTAEGDTSPASFGGTLPSRGGQRRRR
ncbi:MAG: response regulator, partial [Lachnospiraceae bacterium]|nr:response regulator [Lachnospiraceae bacterium]